MGNMIDVLTDQMDNIASSAVESAPFDKSTSGRIVAVLDGNKYTVKMSDGTEKSVLSLTSDSFTKGDVVIVSALQNDPKNSYIVGKPGVSKISPSGYGDMAKGTYDTNNNGIVDNAEKVNGHTVQSDVPAGAVFTDTTYSDATTSAHGLMSSADKTKLDGIAAGAEVNVNADFNATSGDAQILNLPSAFPPSPHSHTKSDITDFPTIPDQLSDLLDDTSHRLVTDTEKSTWNSKQSALSGDITGHYHATDRNRANHTGTQTASTISDFSSAALSAAPAETVSSIGSLVYGATAKTSPIDTDAIPIMDSADSNKIKKFSWAYVKSVLSTYFGSIFAAISHTHTTSQITDMPTSLPANGGNAATVNNHTVNKDVPSDALFTDTTYVNVTTSVHGLMSSSDKTKLDGIATGANNYSLPVATSDILGGIKSGTDITVDSSGNVSVADNSHNHTISNVTGLQSTLDGLLTNKLDSGVYTASDILAKTKTVDGTGSGLDADLLDGKEASAFSLNSHTHDSRYYTESEIQTSSISLRNPFINANGVPTSNLGSPNLAEMALFDSEFTNKTWFYTPSVFTFEYTTDGSTWVTQSVSTDVIKNFVSGNSNASISIPNGCAQYRITIRNNGNYVYLNALYMYWSSNGHSSKVQIYKKRDDGDWVQHTSATNTVGAWPGHLYIPFPTIPWSLATTGGHYNNVRILFIPTWNSSYPSNNITLSGLEIWGGYPSGRRTIYSWDSSQNVTFPAQITATQFNGNAIKDGNGNVITSTYAPISSPSFMGTPSAPTATAGTNTTQVATTAFVQNAVSSSSGGTTIVVSASQPSSQATNDMWFAVV